MKKLLALVLTGVMVMGLSMSAVAAPYEDSTTNTGVKKTYDSSNSTFTDGAVSKGDVNIKIKDPSPSTVYYVVVNWDSLDFQYDFGTGAKWDPTQHKYIDGTGAQWNKKEARILVTNHSNADVEISAKFSDDTTEKTVKNVKATLKNTTFKLKTGVGRTYGDDTVLNTSDSTKADSNEIKVEISDTEPAATTDYLLDTIKVTISK